MARSRICLRCGNDFGASPPWREPRYGLLVCTCPACGLVAPAPRWSRYRKIVAPWFRLANNLVILLLLLGMVWRVTTISERLFAEPGLNAEALLAPGGWHRALTQFPEAWRSMLDAGPVLPASIVARVLGAGLMGLWFALGSASFFHHLLKVGCAWIVCTGVGFYGGVISLLGVHGGGEWDGFGRQAWDVFWVSAIPFLITFAASLAAYPLRGLGTRSILSFTRRWRQRRLRRARRARLSMAR